MFRALVLMSSFSQVVVSPARQTVPQGDAATLTCSVGGVEDPSFTWTKIGGQDGEDGSGNIYTRI